MAFLYGSAGRLKTKNGGFRPGQAADDHGDRLIDMAVHGCLSNMGGQVCRCGVASVRYSVSLVPAQFKPNKT